MASLVIGLALALALPSAGAAGQERRAADPTEPAGTSGRVVAAPTGTIVWSKGGQIWAMGDDGTDPRVLVPLAAAPGMTSLREPAVHPAGALVTFNGNTTANRVVSFGMCGVYPYTYPCNTTHYGFNSTGAYRWQNGVATRLTGPPAYGFETTSGDDTPEPRADGHVVYRFQMCNGTWAAGSYDCVGAVKSTSGEQYPTCESVTDPSPNPVAPGEIAFTGCTVGGENALVVTVSGGSSQRVLGCDDSTQSDPSWSPAGDQVVTAEGGTDPGLWVYGAGNSACYSGSLRHAVVAPAGTTFASPRFIGSSRILFEANGDLWTVPASCSQCSFPGQATQLTSGGDNYEPAWTSATLSVGPPPTTPPPTPTPTDPAPILDLSKTTRKQKVSSTRAVVVRLQVSEAVQVKVVGKVAVAGKDPRLTKRAGVGPESARVKVRLSDKALRAIRQSWRKGRRVAATLHVTVTDSVGSATTRTVKVRLVR